MSCIHVLEPPYRGTSLFISSLHGNSTVLFIITSRYFTDLNDDGIAQAIDSFLQQKDKEVPQEGVSLLIYNVYIASYI